MQEETEASELDSKAVEGVQGSIIISVPDGPTLAAHEISTLSFTQAFAIYKVLHLPLPGSRAYAHLKSLRGQHQAPADGPQSTQLSFCVCATS